MNRFLFLLMLIPPSVVSIAQKKTALGIQWREAGALPPTADGTKAIGAAGAVSGIHNNVLLVAGGANFPDAMPWAGGKKAYHDDVYVFQKKSGSLVHCKTVKLPFNIAYSASCTTPQGVVAIGGENENGLRDEVFLLQWEETKKNINVEPLPSLPFALVNASAVFFKGSVYVAGGERRTDVYNGLLRLDLNDTAAGWKGLPPLPKPVSHAVMLTQRSGTEDCLYLIGGRKRNAADTSTLYASVLQFNPTTGKWTEKQPLPYALSAGTGVACGSRYLLLFGGDAGETFHKTESLIAAVNKENNEEKKKTLNEEKTRVQSTHPGFCRQVLLYDTVKDKWQKLDCMPFPAPVTTTAFWWNDAVVIPGGEIKAGVRSPTILTGRPIPFSFFRKR